MPLPHFLMMLAAVLAAAAVTLWLAISLGVPFGAVALVVLVAVGGGLAVDLAAEGERELLVFDHPGGRGPRDPRGRRRGGDRPGGRGRRRTVGDGDRGARRQGDDGGGEEAGQRRATPRMTAQQAQAVQHGGHRTE